MERELYKIYIYIYCVIGKFIYIYILNKFIILLLLFKNIIYIGFRYYIILNKYF